MHNVEIEEWVLLV